MNDLLANWADLGPEQRELLLLLLQEQGVDIDQALILPAERPAGRAPLSFAQQRLWFLDQLTPGTSMYNIPSAVRLSGRLDVEALHRALNEVVRRHEILRTVFGADGDEPAQIIIAELALPLPMIDLRQARQLAPAMDNGLLAATAHLAAEEAQRPFDLATGPLLRASLLRLADDDHVLLFNMHHIVSDGWSVGVLINEVTVLYAAFCRGEGTSPLPPLPIQYADFAAWQRRYLRVREDGTSPLQEQLDYWRSRLAGSPALLELPTDRPRPAVQTSHGAVQPFALDRPTSEALKRLAQAEEATAFMCLLAAFHVLLHRYSGQDDIPVGTPVANRTRAELEPLIGFFANTLVIRADLSARLTFRVLLRQVRGLVVEAQANQDVQFEMLVEALKPQRDMSYTPLFQAMFSYQQAATRGAQLPGLTLSPLDAHSGTAKFDLLLNIADTVEGFAGSLEYNTDLFDASTIARMLGNFRVLLEGIAAAPDTAITALPLLTPAERQTLLVDWNATAADIATAGTIHERFSQQAARTPDAIAVLAEGEAEALAGAASILTFAELDARSNQLAHYLRTRGVGPEQIVGLLTERSLDTLVGLFGILKAGAAYLPLDPAYPADRVRYMLEDSGARVLITQERVLEAGNWRLEAGNWKLAVARLDTDWPEIAQHPTSNIQHPTSNSLAYIIYTSGSTGRPKGVMVPHRTALNLAGALHRAAYAHSPLDRPLRLSLNAPLAFDASVQQLVMLTYGHTLVVIPQVLRSDAPALLAFIRRHRLDQLDCVPSQLKLLLAAGLLAPAADWTPSIVFPGGEAIDAATWATLAAAPATDFFNMYGPTECTVDATTACARLAPQRPTIGRPLANTQVYVLDRHQQPVPVGVPGELYVGGAGVSRGYLGRPDLTAERFVPNPFTNHRISESPISNLRQAPGADSRLYRTGDLVRWLPDGTLDFLGRTDFQVKVRGFRIELGEIEAALRRHPALKEAVVLAREDQPGDKRLVAYLVPQPGTAVPSVADLRRHLLADLPEYMVPSAFVPLAALPLTPNAKLDRKALPAPEAGLIDTGVDYIAPRTPTEEVLAAIWATLLGLPRVGAQDNFFELGGHSLSATQLVSRVRETFQVELPLRSLFETPTVAGLAEAVDRAMQKAAGAIPPPIQPVSRGSDLPLSFAQQRLWFLDQLEPGSILYNIPAAIKLSGRLDVVALERSLNEIVRRHEGLRTTFKTNAGVAIQEIAAELRLTIPVHDLTAIPPTQLVAEIERLAAEEARRPFDLARGPLLRCQLLKTGADQHVMLLTVHHIISDGWSTGIMVREIAALYPVFCGGEADAPARVANLPPLPIQYVDYAAWQKSWLKDEVLEAQIAYWRERLADAPPLLELPIDRPRPAVQNYRGANETFSLSKELSVAVTALGQQAGATTFMTLLAAYQTLLYRYTGQPDILVGTPIANRTRAETEGIIGFFVNTLVIRTRFDDGGVQPTFRELLSRVREAALGAYAHQDIPFETVVDAVHPQRNLSHSPIFQAMFVLQNTPSQALHLPELTLESLPVHTGTTPFDLTLVMAETPTGVNASIEYNPDLFDPETIRRIAAHFQTLLESIVADPDRPVHRLTILPADERARLLSEFSGTTHPYPADQCVYQLFERQAAATPDAPALRFVTKVGATPGDEKSAPSVLTYAELNARANQLARTLRKLGVGPESLVGIAIEKSHELMIAILGVMKAGGAWLPLDPTYPADRLAYMLSDSGAQVVLTQQHLMDDRSLTFNHQLSSIVDLDAEWPEIAREPATNLPPVSRPDNLAYVIYTSGSTGRPKGTLLHHRGLTSFMAAYVRVFALGPGDHVLVFSSPNFDASIAEMFTCLLSGATLILAPKELLLSTTALPALLREQRVNWSIIPPPMLAVVPAQDLPDLRTLESGGDAFPTDVARRWAYGRRVFNGYGPTECTIGPTLYEVKDFSLERSVLSIGRPVDNIRTYVLDSELELVPIGVPGELLIGGIGVGRGYLGRPDLTADRFIPDPFSPVPGARMYRTGDQVRFRSDANIDFLGRIDQQVKIRGFRIELGEVEEVLRGHPAVREAAVVARADGQGSGKRLVGYIVPHDIAAMPDISELRRFLLDRLPDYMVPAAFVVMTALPLNPSGKVDRRGLPAPDEATLIDSGTAFVAPSTPAEQILADIWQQVLGVAHVGANDNFFELGGDSILSIQVIARANQAGLRLTPKQLFQAPTVAGLAALAGMAAATQAEQGPVEGGLPLTPIQRWFFDLTLPDRNHWNQSLLLTTRERLTPNRLISAVETLLAHHDALRLRFTETTEGWQQVNAGVEPGSTAAVFAYHDLSTLTDVAATAAVETEAEAAQKSLDIMHGPLLRVVYFDFGAERPGRLLLVIHHLAVDGVSWRILLEDLQAAYQQSESRMTAGIQLPPKTTSFKAWTHKLAEYAQAEAVQRDLSAWLAMGDGWVPPLPVDTAAGLENNTEDSVEQIAATLSDEETRILLQDVPPVYGTEINDILLTALAQTIGRWTGTPMLWVHLEGHGREELLAEDATEINAGIDISRTVGWFTTLYPVRLDLPDGGPGEAIKAVKEQLRAVPQRGLSYGLLRYLSRDPDIPAALAALPEPELTFNYLGQFDQALGPDSPLGPARESAGPDRNTAGPRMHLLDVAGGIAGGRLSIAWTFSRGLHQRSTIEGLAADFMNDLRTLIAHCQSPEAGGYTPSDFSLAGLDQKKLDKLLKKIQK